MSGWVSSSNFFKEDVMRPNRSLVLVLGLGVLAALSANGCAKKEAPAAETAAKPAPASLDAGKIPVTTSSAEARTEFLQGRDKVEKLLITDSIQHFQKAASLDPNFASAELNLATSAPTAREFFEHLNKAVALANNASDGERLLILATEAGANANAVKQKELLDQLVAAYPNDERAHFNMGGYHFGQQDFPKAIDHYKKATEINPTYSSAFNLLGYAYRQNDDFANAEKAFQKYIELIPNDPNPYDSYAELLLKMGKFDESIVQYRKALAIDPNFIASYVGIAADLMYQGKPAEAAAELDTITKRARNDGERRAALFAMTVLHADSGKMARALQTADQQYALGEKTKDVPAMAGDLQLKANIQLESGKPAEAKALFERAVKMIEGSDLSPAIKENARLFLHFNLARVALARKDLATAKTEAEEFRKGAEASRNPGQIRQAHELAGSIALAEKKYDAALAEFEKSNLQNPYNLYRQCLAYQGKGDGSKAKEQCTKAAEFNSLPQMNYAYIRAKAKASAG
jgi:tetratricopeptide (TPR) repeat protein